jgi:type IV secretion system protein VirB2
MISRNSFFHTRSLALFAFAALLILPGIAFADGDPTELRDTACGFFSNISMVLNAVSIVVVTIAVMFSGYKVAFAHARIAEVTPVLIGAVLIGAASQIAKLFLSNSAGSNQCQPSTGFIPNAIDHIAALAQTLQHMV